MMTVPGLALFYGGMVRKKNVLSVLMATFATICLLSVLWAVAGYSLAFTDGGEYQPYIGGLEQGAARRHRARTACRALSLSWSSCASR